MPSSTKTRRKPPEPKPAAPDLSEFLNATKTAIASLPKPAPAKEAAPEKPVTATWEVKIYKGKDVQSYPFELTEEQNKNDAARKADASPAKSAKVEEAAASLLKSFGWSPASTVGADPVAAPAVTPTL